MPVAEKEPRQREPAARRQPRALPEAFTAAAIDRFGPPEVLTPHRLAMPRVGQTEIAISLHAAGVGIWDAKIRDGTWAPDSVTFPLVLGTDGSGIVAAKGPRVANFDVGDRVWAWAYSTPKGGFYADYLVIEADRVGHLPRRLDLVHAGMSTLTALTALHGLDDQLRVRRTDRVLIFGASGAVGTFAVQLAKYRGAYVIATARGRDAQELVRELGADAVIDPHTVTGLARLDQLAPRDLDAVLALAGGVELERCLDHLRRGGRVAYPRGVGPPPANRGGIDVIQYDPVSGTRELERLARIFLDAHMRAVISAEYPLARAADAHRRLEQGHVLGRIGLRI